MNISKVLYYAVYADTMLLQTQDYVGLPTPVSPFLAKVDMNKREGVTVEL